MLRTKEKEYFGKLKAYENGSLNAAIELTPMDK
jgi:syntaxin 16